MKKTYLLGGGIVVLTGAILVGCNGNDDNGTSAAATTTQLTITPSLGKILNAKVILRNINTNTEQSANLIDGKATFSNVPVGATVIAEVKPLTDKITYFDEALNINKDVTGTDLSNFKLRVAIPEVTANQTAGVSAVTEAAVDKIASAPTKAAIQQANTDMTNQIKTKFGATVDILQAPTLIGATTDYANLANDKAGQYATLLALFAKTAQNLGQNTSPALAMLQSLRDDFKNGQLDGTAAEGTILAINVNSPAFQAAKEQAVQAFKASIPKLNSFFSNITFSGGVGTAGDYGTITATSSSGTESTKVTTASVITVNNIKTFTWSDGSGVLTMSQNAQTNQVISVNVSGDEQAGSLICSNTSCTNVTVNSTTKTVTFNNLSVPNLKSTGQAITISGTLKTDIVTQVTGGLDVAIGGTVSAADLAKLAGSYTGTGLLTNGATANNTSCSASISNNGDISVSGGGFSLTVQPNQFSVLTNTTVEGQTFKSVSLVDASLGGAGVATAVFNTAGKPFSVSGSKVSINLQNPTASATTSLVCTFQQP